MQILKEQALYLYGGSEARLAAALGVSRQAAHQWKEGAAIPERHSLRLRYELKAAEIESQTGDLDRIAILAELRREIAAGETRLNGTAYQRAREGYGFKGNREKVYSALRARCDADLAAYADTLDPEA